MRAFLVFTALLCWGAPVHGVEYDVQWWKTGEKVDQASIEKKQNNEPLVDHWVWVACEGFRPKQQPDHDSPSSGAPPLAFMKRVNMLVRGYQGNGNYHLVGTGKVGSKQFEILGWVPKNYVLTDGSAMADISSNLPQRVMVVNTIKYFQDKKVLDDPPILLAPDLGAKAGPNFRLFNIYFVFGETGTEDNGFLLLGSKQDFDIDRALLDDKEPLRAVHGWVDKRRICRWPTREAIMWDPDESRKEGVKTYESEGEAKKVYKGETAKSVSAENWAAGKPPLWPHARMRYPIVPLGKDKKGGDVLYFPGPTNDNKLRKIGVVGHLVNKDGEFEADREEAEKLIALIPNLRREAGEVEIEFIVDDTTSMEDALLETADTIGEMINIAKADKRILRFGITYYADIPEGPDRDDPKKLKKAVLTKHTGLVDSRSPEAAEMLTYLRKKAKKEHPKDSNDNIRPGYDAPEQLFLGLRMGIDEAFRFSTYSRKIVILIGDDGDRDKNKSGTYEAEKAIGKKLTPKDRSPIEFYALQVCKLKSSDALAFKAQTEKIVEFFRKETNNEQLGGYYHIKNLSELKQGILDRFKLLEKKVKDAEDALDGIQKGQFELIDKLEPEHFNALTKGIDPKVLERFKRSKGQLFEYAYVWEKNPQNQQPQIRRQLLVTETELQQLDKALRKSLSFEGGTKFSFNRKQLAAVISDLHAGLHPGTSPRSFSYQDVMRANHGFTFRNELLRLSIDELENKKLLPQSANLVWKLDKCRLLVDEILSGKKYKYSPIDAEDDLERLRGEELSPPLNRKDAFDRGFFIHDSKSVRWYWIDYDKEWP